MGKKKKVKVPVEPFDDWVVVVARELGEKTKGGIYIPKDAREGIQETLYEVVAIGPGRLQGDGTRRPTKVVVGDVVLLKRSLAVRCALQDVVYWIAGDQDVVAKVRRD